MHAELVAQFSADGIEPLVPIGELGPNGKSAAFRIFRGLWISCLLSAVNALYPSGRPGRNAASLDNLLAR